MVLKVFVSIYELVIIVYIVLPYLHSTIGTIGTELMSIPLLSHIGIGFLAFSLSFSPSSLATRLLSRHLYVVS